MMEKAYLSVNMKIDSSRLPEVTKVYTNYWEKFLRTIHGARTKDLVIRNEDVQILHSFNSVEDAVGFLSSEMFQRAVFIDLQPYWNDELNVRIYTAA